MKKMFKLFTFITALTAVMIFCPATVSAYSVNPSYTYTTTNDEAFYSTADPTTNGKILVFGRPKCGRTSGTLSRIAASDWIEAANVDVAFIDIDNSPKSDIADFEQSVDCKYITFCYGQASYYDYVRSLSSSAFSNGSYSLPLIAYINKYDGLVAVTSGSKTDDEVYYTMFGIYPAKTERNLENCTVSGVALTYEYTGEPIDPAADMSIISEKGRKLRYYYDYRGSAYKYTNCGEHSFTIKGAGDYEGTSTTVTYYIVPKATKVSKVISPKKDYIKIKYNGSYGADGYQIFLSTSNKFTSKTTRKIKAEDTSVTVKAAAGTYYIKVRPYITENGKRVYGAWSEIYTCTVK